jgi:hypothetical protein
MNKVKLPITVLTTILDMVREYGDYEQVALMEIDLSQENVEVLTEAIETIVPVSAYGRQWALNEMKGIDYEHDNVGQPE